MQWCWDQGYEVDWPYSWGYIIPPWLLAPDLVFHRQNFRCDSVTDIITQMSQTQLSGRFIYQNLMWYTKLTSLKTGESLTSLCIQYSFVLDEAPVS